MFVSILLGYSSHFIKKNFVLVNVLISFSKTIKEYFKMLKINILWTLKSLSTFTNENYRSRVINKKHIIKYENLKWYDIILKFLFKDSDVIFLL